MCATARPTAVPKRSKNQLKEYFSKSTIKQLWTLECHVWQLNVQARTTHNIDADCDYQVLPCFIVYGGMKEVEEGQSIGRAFGVDGAEFELRFLGL